MNIKRICFSIAILALLFMASCGIFKKAEPVHDALKAYPTLAAYPVAYPVKVEGAIGAIVVYNNGSESYRINRNVIVERKVGGKWVEIPDNSVYEPLPDPWWEIGSGRRFSIGIYRRIDPADMEGLYRVTVPVENDDRLVRCEFRVVQDYDDLPLSEKLSPSPFSSAEKSSEELQIHIDPVYSIDPVIGSLRFEYTMKNMTDRTLYTGESEYWMEICLDGKWYSTPQGPDELMVATLPPGEEVGPLVAVLRTEWWTYWGRKPADVEWPEGKYRLVKEVRDGMSEAETHEIKRYYQTFELKY